MKTEFNSLNQVCLEKNNNAFGKTWMQTMDTRSSVRSQSTVSSSGLGIKVINGHVEAAVWEPVQRGRMLMRASSSICDKLCPHAAGSGLGSLWSLFCKGTQCFIDFSVTVIKHPDKSKFRKQFISVPTTEIGYHRHWSCTGGSHMARSPTSKYHRTASEAPQSWEILALILCIYFKEAKETWDC